MSKEQPDPAAFVRLRKLIQDEEDLTRQYARRVRISKNIARDLMAMEAEDWLEASKGFADLNFCRELANDFLRRGEIAATGLSISVIGPVLEVSDDDSATEVEITVGLPWPR